jgi:surface protein
MFQGCGALTELNISTWDVSKVTTMAALCSGCNSLPSLDISKWKLNQAEKAEVNMSKMFLNCFALSELDLPKEGTGNVTDMSALFNGCHALASLDLSGWDTGKVTTMQEMFASCKALSSLKLPNDVSEVTNMSSMFKECRELTELDLSAWDITKEDNTTKINMDQMFYMGDKQNFGKLKTIYVGENWDPAVIGSSSNMFFNAVDLPNYDASTVDASKAHAGAGGYLTKK